MMKIVLQHQHGGANAASAGSRGLVFEPARRLFRSDRSERLFLLLCLFRLMHRSPPGDGRRSSGPLQQEARKRECAGDADRKAKNDIEHRQRQFHSRVVDIVFDDGLRAEPHV